MQLDHAKDYTGDAQDLDVSWICTSQRSFKRVSKHVSTLPFYASFLKRLDEYHHKEGQESFSFGCSVSKQLLKEGLEGFSLGDPFYTICTLCFQNFFELLDGEVNKNF